MGGVPSLRCTDCIGHFCTTCKYENAVRRRKLAAFDMPTWKDGRSALLRHNKHRNKLQTLVKPKERVKLIVLIVLIALNAEIALRMYRSGVGNLAARPVHNNHNKLQ